MNEKPLERLKYYNGQRLEASDFKTEQDYHIRTKRWLNKSIYSAGIARGLEVREVPGIPSVMVSPGLALDSEGREIILLEEDQVEAYSYAGTDESTVVGNYLVIEYAEETIAYEKGGCVVRAEGTSANKSTTNWGGPSRIQAQVKFSWVPFVPHPGSNQIVLARVELTAPNCDSVHQIDVSARRYIGAASAAMVRQYALEGEREVAYIPKESFPTLPASAPQPTDVEVVGRIYFHIRGRQPNSVTLHLRSESFSSLHYTELGTHAHSASVTTSVADHDIEADDISHVHDLSGVIADVEKGDDVFPSGGNVLSPHYHWIYANIVKAKPDPLRTTPDNVGAYGIVITPIDRSNPPLEVLDNDIILQNPNPPQSIIYGGAHRHKLIMDGPVGSQGLPETAGPTKFTKIVLRHTNPTSTPTINPTGVALLSRNGEPLTFVDGLQIFLGPSGDVARTVNRTADIQQQLADANRANWVDGAGNLKALGDGSGNHVLVMSGTGPIRLDFLPHVSFAEGEYCIELKVDAKIEAGKRVANGGKILYNLYVE